MAADIPPTRRDEIAMCLRNAVPDDRKTLFQILDSMAMNFVRFGVVPWPRIWAIPEVYVEFADHVYNYLRTLTSAQKLEAFRDFEQHRAKEQFPEPIVWVMVEGDPPVDERAELCKLADVQHINDHVYRHLVKDGLHATQILREYAEIENQAAMELEVDRSIQENRDPYPYDQDICNLQADPINKMPYVQRLFDAMAYMPQGAEGIDRKHKDHGMPGAKDSPAVARTRNAANVVLEALSWKLLDAIVEAQIGNIHTTPWQGYKAKQLYESYPSFQARFDHVVAGLSKCKAFVDNMMLPKTRYRLAAVPEGMLKRKQINKATNENRDSLLTVGRQVVNASLANPGAGAGAGAGVGAGAGSQGQ